MHPEINRPPTPLESMLGSRRRRFFSRAHIHLIRVIIKYYQARQDGSMSHMRNLVDSSGNLIIAFDADEVLFPQYGCQVDWMIAEGWISPDNLIPLGSFSSYAEMCLIDPDPDPITLPDGTVQNSPVPGTWAPGPGINFFLLRDPFTGAALDEPTLMSSVHNPDIAPDDRTFPKELDAYFMLDELYAASGQIRTMPVNPTARENVSLFGDRGLVVKVLTARLASRSADDAPGLELRREVARQTSDALYSALRFDGGLLFDADKSTQNGWKLDDGPSHLAFSARALTDLLDLLATEGLMTARSCAGVLEQRDDAYVDDLTEAIVRSRVDDRYEGVRDEVQRLAVDAISFVAMDHRYNRDITTLLRVGSHDDHRELVLGVLRGVVSARNIWRSAANGFYAGPDQITEHLILLVKQAELSQRHAEFLCNELRRAGHVTDKHLSDFREAFGISPAGYSVEEIASTNGNDPSSGDHTTAA